MKPISSLSNGEPSQDELNLSHQFHQLKVLIILSAALPIIALIVMTQINSQSVSAEISNTFSPALILGILISISVGFVLASLFVLSQIYRHYLNNQYSQALKSMTVHLNKESTDFEQARLIFDEHKKMDQNLPLVKPVQAINLKPPQEPTMLSLLDALNHLIGQLNQVNNKSIQDKIDCYKQQQRLQQTFKFAFEHKAERLRKMTTEAEKASNAKSDFLAMMSHEIRTPMNGIVASLDLLRFSQVTVEQQDLIDAASSSAINLVQILNDILDISKIEAGKFDLEQVEFSISEVIDNVIKAFIPSALERKIILEVREDNQLPDKVIGDPVRIRQILFNIVGNAIKFTPTNEHKIGKIVIDVRLNKQEGNSVSLSFVIKDNGIGIKKRDQEKLFVPFNQAEKSTSRKYGGTGLGLAICYKLTHMMHGSIDFNSTSKVGTEFIITLPLQLASPNDLSLPCLFGEEIHFIECNAYLTKLVGRLSEYIINEGGEASRHEWTQTESFNQLNGTLILMLGEVDKYANILADFLKFADNKNHRCIVAVERNELNKLRLFSSTIEALPIKPLTKFQFYKSIVNEPKSHAEPKAPAVKANPVPFSTVENKPPTHSTLSESTSETEPEVADILLVEDNPLNQKLISKQLAHLGFKVDVAADGYIGLQKYKDKQYKLIITDCHMPNLNGYDMVYLIRKYETKEDKQPVAVIALTGAAMKGDKEKCFSIGMNDFLTKPVQTHELEAIIQKYL